MTKVFYVEIGKVMIGIKFLMLCKKDCPTPIKMQCNATQRNAMQVSYAGKNHALKAERSSSDIDSRLFGDARVSSVDSTVVE